MDQKLLDYIEGELKRGVKDDEIKAALQKVGWKDEDVDEALHGVSLARAAMSTTKAPAQVRGEQVSPAQMDPFKGWPMQEQNLTVDKSPATEEGSQKKKKTAGAAIFLIVVIILFAAVGGGIWAYFYYFQSPESILSRSLDKVSAANTMEGDVNIAIEINSKVLSDTGASGEENAEESNYQANIGAEIAFDKTEPSTIKESIDFQYEDNSFFDGAAMEGDIRVIGPTSYLRVKELPNLGIIDLSPFEGKWIRVDLNEYASQIEKMNPEAAKKLKGKQPGFDPSKTVELRRILDKYRVVSISGSLPVERQDAGTYHYGINFDKEQMKEAWPEINALIQEQESQDEPSADTDGFFDAVESAEGEVWIKKKDLMPYRFILKLNFSDPGKYDGNITASILYKGFDKEVAIEEPRESNTIEELFGQMLPSLAQGMSSLEVNADSPANVKDAKRMSDMRQLAAAQSMLYGDNKKYYTCGIKDGDCGGRLFNYPEQMPPYLASLPQDVMYDSAKGAKNKCGTDYVYCGLDNTTKPQSFCYYAKLEEGGYYTASQKGNFTRSAAPKTFEECGTEN